VAIHLDADSRALLDQSVERYAAANYTFEQRRRSLGAAPGYSVEAWHDYARFGWLALPLGEAQGGLGDDPAATGTLASRLGAALALEPVFGSAILCGRLLVRCADSRADEALSSIASGAQVLALAHGESAEDGVAGTIHATARAGRLSGAKTLVLHGDVADQLVVSARQAGDGPVGLYLVEARDPGVTIAPYRLVDGRGAATLTLDAARGEPVGPEDAAAIIDIALDDARLALASECWGIVRMLHDLTLAHLRTRHQFGRPLAANQVLQHRAVDLHIGEQELRAVIDAAERAFDDPGPRRRRAIAAAAALAFAVGRQAAHEAVQLHGGMGMTDDLPVSHAFRRLMVAARLLGDRDRMLARFAGAAESARR